MIKEFFKSLISREIPADIGEIYLEWTFPEYVKRDRAKSWYAGAIIFGSGLMVYSILTINFLFAIIVLLFAFIGIYQHYQEPRRLKVTMAEDGIVVDNSFYAYSEFKSFWLLYNPPLVKTLNFGFKSSNSQLTISLDQANPLKVREAIEPIIYEDLTKESESLSEVFSRVIKL
jgi:hypothetical protein